MNKICLMGRLTANPELKTTSNGTAVTSFSIAVDRPYAGSDGSRPVDFIPCQAWRKTAEFISKYFGKGQMIALDGALQTRHYEDKNGNKRVAFEVVVEHAFFTGSKSQTQNASQQGNNQAAQAAAAPQSAPQQNGSTEYADYDAIEDDDLPF